MEIYQPRPNGCTCTAILFSPFTSEDVSIKYQERKNSKLDHFLMIIVHITE